MTVLGYWKARGLAAPIQYILEHVGAPYEKKTYIRGPPPDYSGAEWEADKDNLGLDMPNLPYLIDGENRLSQSLAIMSYLARKYDLEGESEEARQRADLATAQAHDLRMALVMLGYQDWDNEDLKTAFEKQSLPKNLGLFEKFLGDERPFMAGTKVTTADFLVYETLEWISLMFPSALSGYPNLSAFHARIRALPHLADFLASDRFAAWPMFGPSAKFGGKEEERPESLK